MDWTKEEVRYIIEDYFKMLQLELNHLQYNKTQHRNSLIPLLNNRSKGSVEFKHCNISAALINMGLPFIKGYMPRFNYQKQLLEKEISDFIKENLHLLEKEFDKFSSETFSLKKNSNIDFAKILNDDPFLNEIQESEPLYRPVKINYLEKLQNNQSLGEAGEDLVIKYEKWRLINLGKEDFADKVEWVSKEQGDGAGFDILSRNLNGTDRYIEVKTTTLTKETPIYLTRTELNFALAKEKNFYLYRVFNFTDNPELFIRHGNYAGFCHLEPQTFKGYF